MSLRFVLVATGLILPSLVSAQTRPVFTFENGVECHPYNECTQSSMCEGANENVCAHIVTGELVCVNRLETRFDLVCCDSADDCVDTQSVQGKCVQFDQPTGNDFKLCIWDTPRNFNFCRAITQDPTIDLIEACLGEVASANPTLAEKLRAGDCDSDGVANGADLCPCEAGNGDSGCNLIADGGVGDASVNDASVSTDATVTSDGTFVPRDAIASSDPVQFGGGGGCKGCAAGEAGGGDLATVLVTLLALLVKRRRV